MSTFETTRTNDEAFEKWYKEKYYKYDLYPKYAQFRKEMKEVWQAATAESDKRIAELKANTSQIVQAVSRAADAREAGMENEIIALQKHINVLRENLDYAYYEVNTHFAKNIKDLLASTPAQSLQAHDNEVIERCAQLCENQWDVDSAAADIRKLKQ